MYKLHEGHHFRGRCAGTATLALACRYQVGNGLAALCDGESFACTHPTQYVGQVGLGFVAANSLKGAHQGAFKMSRPDCRPVDMPYPLKLADRFSRLNFFPVAGESCLLAQPTTEGRTLRYPGLPQIDSVGEQSLLGPNPWCQCYATRRRGKPVIALVNLSGIQDNRVPRRCTWTCGAIHLGAHFVP